MASSRKIVLAVDGSCQAQYAFNFYVDNLHQEGNTVILLHCVEPLTSIGEIPNVDMYEQMLESSKLTAQTIENRFMEQLQNHKILGSFVSIFSHRPGEALVTRAKEEEGSLIVTGSRGLNTMRRTVLGSVSDYVLHHAHCPVVVCRKKDNKQT